MMIRVTLALLIVLCIACSDKAAKNKGTADSTAISQSMADSLKEDSLAIAYGGAKADHYNYNIEVDAVPDSLMAFVPEGYEGLDTTSGDLNGDAYTDIIMVLMKKGEDEDIHANSPANPVKRPMLILLGQADGSYKQVARNDNAVLCFYCGGSGHQENPFEQVVARNGFFSIEHSTGSRNEPVKHITTFRYSPSDSTWLLHRDGWDLMKMDEGSEFKKVKSIIKTAKDFGKIRFEDFDIYKEEAY
ncbi:MAG: hypothetical protein J7578_00265 [Chitinophagaceae bacterium]|nr:hypothetical protein [Chitinophagaceae bacterium]